MGIGGSGMSGVAQIAKAYGYDVSGCDQATDTPYLDKVKAAGIEVYPAHSSTHVNNIDLLAVSPAIFYQNDAHPETQYGRIRDILLTWEQFLGQYLHKDKFVICIAGTHGKSTTTALAGLLLEKASLDPTVEVGATIKEWHNNVRIGTSQYFISEADEYHDNFLAYHPNIVILNNVEFDHPEYFGSFENMLLSYQNFLANMKPNSVLIYNSDDPGIQKLLSLPQVKLLSITQIPYSHSEYSPTRFPLGIPGRHNQSNALGIIKLAQVLKIDESIVASVLQNFSGLARRLELVGEPHGIKIYDDYANLPTAFKLNIDAVKELHPNSKLWVVIEPHTFSRLHAVLTELPNALQQADEIIISQIFASREKDPGNFTGQDISDATNHSHARYIPEFADITTILKSETKPGDVILIMGSGNSYKLSRELVSSL